jgi:hypothetical protein
LAFDQGNPFSLRTESITEPTLTSKTRVPLKWFNRFGVGQAPTISLQGFRGGILWFRGFFICILSGAPDKDYPKLISSYWMLKRRVLKTISDSILSWSVRP